MELLKVIEEGLLRELNPKVKLVLETGRYIVEGGGKRLRPLLTLLTCGMCGGNPEDALPLGVGLEYIHVASLLHDDVVDGAESRRGRKSANLVFGNGVAVLTGDYMYAKALHLFSTYGNMEMIRIVSSAVMDMAEGQVLEISKVGDIITEEEYFRIIDGKTAVLFGACLGVGAIKGGCENWSELFEAGLRIGRAFQLVDDALDYEGDPQKLGKPTGNDLREGKCTYPLIAVLEKLDREWVKRVLRGREEPEALRQEVVRLGGTLKAKERAREELSRARKIIESYPPGEYREEILRIVDFIVERNL
ncbi:MAG: polyprenyl synthetase family protein [Aquificae bacterium]|nr:polyprenyl synthetase family protein [Aquificota bacterium]